jgi:hypothetical protein
LLKVRLNTCNTSVYGELGRYPLYIHRYVRIIKFWLKLVNTDNIILKTVYTQTLEDSNKEQTNWVMLIIF